MELQLPWKRNDGDVDAGIKQSEFPLWVENKEYTNYYSPTNTFLGDTISKEILFLSLFLFTPRLCLFFAGGLDRNTAHPSVIDMFPRELPPIAGPSGASDHGPVERSPSFVVTVAIPEDPATDSDDDDERKHPHRRV